MLQADISDILINEMEYLSEILHVDIERTKYEGISKFPLYLRGQFEFDILSFTGDSVYLALRPKEKMALPRLRKAYLEMKQLTGLVCILELDHLSKYAEEQMTKEGIPFYVKGGAIYLPFGMYLPGSNTRAVKPIEVISYSTQKLLLAALYKRWEGKKSADIAEALGVSAMTVSRAFDEIEGAGLPLVTRMGRKRYFDNYLCKRVYYSLIEPVLRNPVKKTLLFASMPEEGILCLGGMSALAHYTMLVDKPYPTFGTTQKYLKSIGYSQYDYVPLEEEPAAVVNILGYVIDDFDSKAIDPISAILSINETDRDDERVAKEIEKLKERILNDTGA